MPRTFRLFSLGLFLAPVLLAQPQAAESSKDLALRLVRATLSRQATEDMLMRSIPAGGDAAEVARALLRQDTTFWNDYEKELANLYERHLSAAELRQVVAFYESEVGKKWAARQPVVLAAQLDGLKEGKGALVSISEIGCATALVTPALAKAKQKAGITAPGVPADFLKRLEAVTIASRRFCGCIFTEGTKRGVNLSLGDSGTFEKIAQEAIQAGTCPLPALDTPQ